MTAAAVEAAPAGDGLPDVDWPAGAGQPEPDAPTRTAVVVYRYGAPTRGGKKALHLHDDVVDQFRLANELWNALVELDRDREAARAEVFSSYPEVAAVQAELAAADEHIAELAEQVKAASIALRKKQPDVPARGELAAARKARKALREKEKAATADRKEDAKARIAAVEAGHAAAVKALYDRFCVRRGLYWATYNDVRAHFQTAVQRIIEARNNGRPAQLRFHRFDGSGSIAVQLQRGNGRAAVRAAVPDPAAVSAHLAPPTPPPAADKAATAEYKDTLKRHTEQVKQLAAAARVTPQVWRAAVKAVRAACDDAAAAAVDPDTGEITAAEPDPPEIVFADVAEPHAVAIAAALAHAGIPADVTTLKDGAPVRSPRLLASGAGPWKNVLQVSPWVPPEQFTALARHRQAEHAREGRVVYTIGSKDGGQRRYVLPVVTHRMLPAEADITGARIVAERLAGRTQYSVHITAKIPAAPPKPGGGPTVALHLGWRRDPDTQGLRVATWRSDQPLSPPPHLRDVVTVDSPTGTGTTGQVILPSNILDQLARPDLIRSRRDKAMQDIRATLVAWLTEHPPPDADGDDGGDDDGGPVGERPVTAARVARWRSPGRFAVLAMRWRDTPPDGEGGADIADALETWRRIDKGWWETEANSRAKAVGRRKDAYRRVAAWLAREAWRVVVDDTNLAAVARRRDDDESQPTVVADRASAARFAAAPGELRAAVVAAAVRDGCNVPAPVPHAGLTLIHARCGHKHQPGDDRFAKSAIVQCANCGQAYDQDDSATAMMLTRAGDA